MSSNEPILTLDTTADFLKSVPGMIVIFMTASLIFLAASNKKYVPTMDVIYMFICAVAVAFIVSLIFSKDTIPLVILILLAIRLLVFILYEYNKHDQICTSRSQFKNTAKSIISFKEPKLSVKEIMRIVKLYKQHRYLNFHKMTDNDEKEIVKILNKIDLNNTSAILLNGVYFASTPDDREVYSTGIYITDDPMQAVIKP